MLVSSQCSRQTHSRPNRHLLLEGLSATCCKSNLNASQPREIWYATLLERFVSFTEARFEQSALAAQSALHLPKCSRGNTARVPTRSLFHDSR